MEKTRVVVFFYDKTRIPRVFINPDNLELLQTMGDILVNPSIPKGIAPNKWKLVNGRIRTNMTIEKAFPTNKQVNTDSVHWFRPFVLLSLLCLVLVEVRQEKEFLIDLVEKLQHFLFS